MSCINLKLLTSNIKQTSVSPDIFDKALMEPFFDTSYHLVLSIECSKIGMFFGMVIIFKYLSQGLLHPKDEGTPSPPRN